MNKISFLSILLVLISIITVNSQTLTLTPGTPAQLIMNGFAGSGVMIDSITGQITPNSAARFVNNGIPGFPFSSGFVLSTGPLANLVNAPQTTLSTDMSLAGDSTLDAMVSPQQTHDAQVIKFHCIPASDTLEFEFIFSSEEYNEYVNTPFVDAFGFFITGPGYSPNTNLALVPGTMTPINVNTINNGNSSVASTGPCNNCSLFIDNLAVPTPVGLAPDGFTVPIKMRFHVMPCQDYYFKFALADVNDGLFDSQLYFKGGSMQVTTALVPLINGIAAPPVVHLCEGDSVTFSAPPSYLTMWNIGDTTTSITVNHAGTFNFFVSQGICFSFSQNVQVVMADSIADPVLYLTNDTLYSTTNDPTLTYNWILNGSAISASSSSIPSPVPGCYQLQVSNASGCVVLSDTLCITPTGLTNYFEQHTSIYPNPANNFITIKLPVNENSISEVTIYDICGNIAIPTQSITGNKGDVDVSVLPLGIYTVEIFSTLGGYRKYVMLVKN